MNRLSMDLSELTLSPNNFDEETWLTGPENGTDNPDEDQEDLDKWLQGAVRKVDFRTRSALSRRLEKKKQKHDGKERRSKDFSLASIEECSSECNSDREKHKDQRRTLSVRQQNNIMGSDEEDDLFFDATGEADQSSNSEIYVTPRNSNDYSSLRSAKRGDNQASQARVNRVSSVDTLTTPRRDVSNRKLVPPALDFSDGSETPEDPLHIAPKPMSLEEIERRAREQERELRMECTSANRRHRGSSPHSPATSDDVVSHRSRPNSSSSTCSSTNYSLATSKSVDFCSPSYNQETPGSRSNEGSLNDLHKNDSRTATLNSRLPLPRRPAIPGRTNIPVPAPTKSVRTLSRKQKSEMHFDDEECF